MFEPGVYVDPAEEYERAAKYCADYFGRVIPPTSVHCLIPCGDDVLESILANPQEWYQRVNDYLYAQYMEEHGL
jgi:hypothetical protein